MASNLRQFAARSFNVALRTPPLALITFCLLVVSYIHALVALVLFTWPFLTGLEANNDILKFATCFLISAVGHAFLVGACNTLTTIKEPNHISSKCFFYFNVFIFSLMGFLSNFVLSFFLSNILKNDYATLNKYFNDGLLEIIVTIIKAMFRSVSLKDLGNEVYAVMLILLLEIEIALVSAWIFAFLFFFARKMRLLSTKIGINGTADRLYISEQLGEDGAESPPANAPDPNQAPQGGGLLLRIVNILLVIYGLINIYYFMMHYLFSWSSNVSGETAVIFFLSAIGYADLLVFTNVFYVSCPASTEISRQFVSRNFPHISSFMTFVCINLAYYYISQQDNFNSVFMYVVYLSAVSVWSFAIIFLTSIGITQAVASMNELPRLPQLSVQSEQALVEISVPAPPPLVTPSSPPSNFVTGMVGMVAVVHFTLAIWLWSFPCDNSDLNNSQVFAAYFFGSAFAHANLSGFLYDMSQGLFKKVEARRVKKVCVLPAIACTMAFISNGILLDVLLAMGNNWPASADGNQSSCQTYHHFALYIFLVLTYAIDAAWFCAICIGISLMLFTSCISNRRPERRFAEPSTNEWDAGNDFDMLELSSVQSKASSSRLDFDMLELSSVPSQASSSNFELPQSSSNSAASSIPMSRQGVEAHQEVENDREILQARHFVLRQEDEQPLLASADPRDNPFNIYSSNNDSLRNPFPEESHALRLKSRY